MRKRLFLFLLLFVNILNVDAQRMEKNVKFTDNICGFQYSYADYDFNNSFYVWCYPVKENSFYLFKEELRSICERMLKSVPVKIALGVYFDQDGNLIKINFLVKDEYYKYFPEDKILDFFKQIKNKFRPFDFVYFKEEKHDVYYSRLSISFDI